MKKLQAPYAEEYYEKYMDILFAKHKNRFDCDYEAKLSHYVPTFEDVDIPGEYKEKARQALIKIYAPMIVDKAVDKLLDKEEMIRSIKSGESCLGYTTWSQEVLEMRDLVEGFEFSCYMLEKFKQKYGVN